MKKQLDGDEYKNADDAGKLRMVKNAETELLTCLKLMYGLVGWKKYNCTLVDNDSKAITSPTVLCGDKGYDSPNCPLKDKP